MTDQPQPDAQLAPPGDWFRLFRDENGKDCAMIGVSKETLCVELLRPDGTIAAVLQQCGTRYFIQLNDATGTRRVEATLIENQPVAFLCDDAGELLKRVRLEAK